MKSDIQKSSNVVYLILFLLHTDVPKLPLLSGEVDEEEKEEKPTVIDKGINSPSPGSASVKKKRENAPRIPNPYGEESNMLLPIFVSIAAFIPLLFCICKLWCIHQQYTVEYSKDEDHKEQRKYYKNKV